MAKTKQKAIRTPKFRVAWPCVYQKEKDITTGEEKDLYSFVMLIPKDEDISELEQLTLDAAKAKWPDKFEGVKLGDAWPRGYNNPFKDGDDRPDYDGYAGTTYCRAMSKFKIATFIRRDGAVVLNQEEEELYGGRNCVATVTAFAYDQKVNKGVTLGAQALMLLNGGTTFQGTGSTDGMAMFGDVEDDGDELEDTL